jgi:hypothetical protein
MRMGLDRHALADLMAEYGRRFAIDVDGAGRDDGRCLVASRNMPEIRAGSVGELRHRLAMADQREAAAAGALVVTVPPWLSKQAAKSGRPAAALLAEAVAAVLDQELDQEPAPDGNDDRPRRST